MKQRKVKTIQTHIGVRINGAEVTTSVDAEKYKLAMYLEDNGVYVMNKEPFGATFIPFSNTVQVFMYPEEPELRKKVNVA